VQDPLDPVTGGLVMTAWTVAMLAGAAVVFARRDA
jgi:ABC-2 type transport system permease protein